MKAVLNRDLGPLARKLLRDSLEEPKRYPNFDLIRLMLAVEVMLMHFSVYGQAPTPFRSFVPAVPCFIGVSGFLILRSFELDPSWLRFAWKRVCRIWPALGVALAIVLLAFGGRALKEALATYLSSGFYAIPGLPERDGPLWTLMTEEWMYVLLAVLFALGAYRRKWPIWLLAGTILLFATQFLKDLSGDRFVRVNAVASILECFSVGSLMYLYRRTLSRVLPIVWWGLLAIACVWSRFITPNTDQTWVYLWSLASSVSAVAIAAWGPQLWKPRWDLSYGIYVYHSPLFFLAAPTVGPIGAAVATFGVASASWLVVEKPALKAKYGPFRQTRAIIEPRQGAVTEAA